MVADAKDPGQPISDGLLLARLLDVVEEQTKSTTAQVELSRQTQLKLDTLFAQEVSQQSMLATMASAITAMTNSLNASTMAAEKAIAEAAKNIGREVGDHAKDLTTHVTTESTKVQTTIIVQDRMWKLIVLLVSLLIAGASAYQGFAVKTAVESAARAMERNPVQTGPYTP